MWEGPCSRDPPGLRGAGIPSPLTAPGSRPDRHPGRTLWGLPQAPTVLCSGRHTLHTSNLEGDAWGPRGPVSSHPASSLHADVTGLWETGRGGNAAAWESEEAAGQACAFTRGPVTLGQHPLPPARRRLRRARAWATLPRALAPCCSRRHRHPWAPRVRAWELVPLGLGPGSAQRYGGSGATSGRRTASSPATTDVNTDFPEKTETWLWGPRGPHRHTSPSGSGKQRGSICSHVDRQCQPRQLLRGLQPAHFCCRLRPDASQLWG